MVSTRVPPSPTPNPHPCATFSAVRRLSSVRADDIASRRTRTDRPARSSAGTQASWDNGGAAADVSYRTLFEQHFHPTVRLARLLGADDPDDIAQEAFVRLHRRHLREPAAALAYVRRTTANAREVIARLETSS